VGSQGDAETPGWAETRSLRKHREKQPRVTNQPSAPERSPKGPAATAGDASWERVTPLLKRWEAQRRGTEDGSQKTAAPRRQQGCFVREVSEIRSTPGC